MVVRRFPVPQRGANPICFGLRHAPEMERCAACPVQPRCRSAMGEWASAESVFERCSNLEREARTPTLDVAVELEVIYDAEYRRVFGKSSRRKRSHRNDLIFSRTLSYLVSSGIDPATFLVANMVALKDAPMVRKHGFQVNMISGPKAKLRYNQFLKQANSKYRRGLSDVAEADSELGSLRRDLFDGEYTVADLFVRTIWSRVKISWAEAILRTEPNLVWKAFEAKAGDAYARWSNSLGERGVQREARLAKFRACVSVLDGLNSGFSRRVGLRDVDFEWLDIAELVIRTFEQPKPSQYDLSHVPGDLWG